MRGAGSGIAAARRAIPSRHAWILLLEREWTALQRQRQTFIARDMTIAPIDAQENIVDDVENDRFSRARLHDARRARPGLHSPRCLALTLRLAVFPAHQSRNGQA